MLTQFSSWIFSLFIFGCSAYLLGSVKELQKRKTFFSTMFMLVALGLPILFAGYRTSGVDTIRYIYDYVTLRTQSFSEIFSDISFSDEPGHTFLTRLLGCFSSVRIYLGVYAALTVYLFYCVTKYLKEEGIALAMMLFYFGAFTTSFNVMRQYLAVSLVAYGYKYVFKRDFAKYLFFVLLAMTFHFSAGISIICYFLWTKKERLLPWPILMLMLVGTIVISVNLDSILTSIADYDLESDALSQYVTYTAKAAREAQNRDFYVDLLVCAVLLMHYSSLVKIDKRNSFFVFLFIISTALGLCGFVNPYTKRIAYYFAIGAYWVLADIPECYSDRHSVWMARVLIILYAITRFTIIASLGQSGVVPYFWILPWWAQI